MHVLVADDHSSVSIVVSQLLASKFPTFSTRVVHEGAALLVALQEGAPVDLLILDLSMPGPLRRVRLVEAVRRIRPDVVTLVYTACESPCVAFACLRAGARGYLSKTSQWSQLGDAIDDVSNGRPYMDPRVDLARGSTNPWWDLTRSELDIVLHLAKGESLDTIARQKRRSYTTVATQRHSAFRKLQVTSDVELVNFMHEHELTFELDPGHRPSLPNR